MKEITLSVNGQPTMTDKVLVEKMMNINSTNISSAIGTDFAPGSKVLCTGDMKLCVLGYDGNDALKWLVIQ